MTTESRSVWGTSTDDFKSHFRRYLVDLSKSDDTYRVELIDRLEWCFDRWTDWREKFYSDTAEPLWFPFFETHRKGSELGSYAVCGNSGQPSVISLKWALLTGSSDVTVFRSSTEKLVLKGDHPGRWKAVEFVILHELVHQFLHEGADAVTRQKYESTECAANSKQTRYKGHGDLFAAECNRISEQLHPELGFRFSPVRHMKRSHAKALSRRVSCGQFGLGNLFFLWDPTLDDLAPHEVTANRDRLEQALKFFGGAIERVPVEQKVDTDFLAPFTDSCATVCHQELAAFDQNNSTTLVREFQLAVVRQLQAEGTLDEALQAVGHSVAPADISPASREKKATAPVEVAAPPCPFSVGDKVRHRTKGDCEVTHLFSPVDGSDWNVGVLSALGEKEITSASSLTPVGNVPASGDNEEMPTLHDRYPLATPYPSLERLKTDLRKSGLTKADFAIQTFGHKNGQQLSRHLKRLNQALTELVGAIAV